jgi:hypothetical protein
MKSLRLFILLLLNVFLWVPIISSCLTEDNKFQMPPLVVDMGDHPDLPAHFVGSGSGKTTLLYQAFAQVHGHPYITRDQGNAPSCVGQSAACAVDILAAVEVRSGHLGLPPPERASASWLYGASRELGGINDKGGGSYCRLAARSMVEMGFLFEDDYWSVGYDLRGDDSKRDIEFGRTLPPQLKQFATSRVKHYYKLTSYKDVRDAINNNMVVIVGSNVGFGNGIQTRDKDGFLNQPRLRFRGRYWFHAMCFTAVSDVGRKGVLCQNSWGQWVTGPKRIGDEPEGSFWIDAHIVDRMAAQGDCWAIQGVQL